MEITVDANVLANASDESSSNYMDAISLLAVILHKKHKIVLDHEKEIFKEYRKFVPPKFGAFTKKWLEEMSWSRFEFRSSKLNNSVKTIISKMTFDRSDIKYLGVCLNSSDKTMISEDGRSFHSEDFHALIPEIITIVEFSNFSNLKTKEALGKL